MSRQKTRYVLALAAIALATSAGLTLRAQGPPREPNPERPPAPGSIQDALVKPFHFAFARPTPIDEAAKEIARTLNAPVAIDRAAIDRLGLKMNDTVQLELDNVRLKTGLKLLLDQLDLTYRVVPEDNLLIITDAAGSADPFDRVLTELRALHRDLHDVQDSIDDIHEVLGLDEGEGAKLRKPTIIEEMPAHDHDPNEKPKPKPKPNDPPAAPGAPRSRPGA